jgi:two-component system NtrC family sensor kinase
VAAWQNWRDIAAFTAGRAERRAALVAEHALKVFEVNEQVLRRVADRVQGLRWDEIENSAEIGAFLTALTAEVGHVQGAGLIGPDGRLRAVSGAFPVPHLDLSDRDYFREPLASEGSTYVAGPTIGRLSGQPFFRLTRRWDDPLGTAGVVFISMAPDYFTQFYRTTTLGEDAITMVRADGVVLSREPPVTSGVERLSPRSGLMQGIAGAERGIYRTVSELDGSIAFTPTSAWGPTLSTSATASVFGWSGGSGGVTWPPSVRSPRSRRWHCSSSASMHFGEPSGSDGSSLNT